MWSTWACWRSGLGLGGAGAYGAVLHVLNNGLREGLLFLAVGNVVLSADIASVGGGAGRAAARAIASGVLLVVGLFAVSGRPRSGPVHERVRDCRVARSSADLPVVAAIMLILLAVIFVGSPR